MVGYQQIPNLGRAHLIELFSDVNFTYGMVDESINAFQLTNRGRKSLID